MRRITVMSVFTVFCFCCLALEVQAEEFCVSTEAELHDALTQAKANGEDDIIKVEQGTYGGSSFSYMSNENNSITLLGGYTAGCADRVVDPSNTTLDAEGSGGVLSIGAYGGGDVSVSGFTLQNAGYRGVWIRTINDPGSPSGAIYFANNIVKDNKDHGGIYLSSNSDVGITGDIILSHNIIVGNYFDERGGGLSLDAYWPENPGKIVIVNNTIVGNKGGAAGGVYMNPGPGAVIIFTNNTISGNHGEGIHPDGDGGGIQINLGNDNVLHLYNNIIRGNTVGSGAGDIKFLSRGTRIGFNNNYSDMSGSWTDSGYNIDTDPLFSNPGFWDDFGTPDDDSDDVWVDGDYHLRFNSPCIDVGSNDAPELPATDFEGDTRVIDGNNDGNPIVDMGSDEFIIDICAGDFDHDGDVDGTDLATLADDPGQLDLTLFAAEFGNSACLIGL